MELLAVIRRPNALEARGWIRLDGRWRRCSRAELNLEREFVEMTNDAGWRTFSPLPDRSATLRAVLAGGPVVLEADHVEVEHDQARSVVRLRSPSPWRVSAGEMAGGRLV